MSRLAQAGQAVAATVALVAVVGVDRPAPEPTTPGTVIEQPTTWSSTLASSGTNGVNTYRLPGLAVTNSGTIVAVYDARRLSNRDLGNNAIDIMQRRSFDQGRTWDAERMIVAHGGGNTAATAYSYGDASLTYDRDTGRLWLFYEGAPPGVSIHNSSTATAAGSMTTTHILSRYSDNEGTTWSAPTNHTALAKVAGATGIWTGSGHGTQLADGTLAIPYQMFITGTPRARYLVSTDHGVTWTRSAEVGAVDEHKLVQLADGSLLDVARPQPTAAGIHEARMLSRAPSLSGPWTTPVRHPSLPDPRCNGDMIRVDPDPASERATWLLSSNPDSQNARENGAIRLSTDNGLTWAHSWIIQPGVFGYSTMVNFADGSYGIFYEHRMPNSLVFTRFTLDAFEVG